MRLLYCNPKMELKIINILTCSFKQPLIKTYPIFFMFYDPYLFVLFIITSFFIIAHQLV